MKADAQSLQDEAPENAAAPAAEKPPLPPELMAKLRVVVPVLWFAAAILGGILNGIELAFLVLAAGALALVITLMWSSVQSLTGGSQLGFEEALGLGAPSKVEEQKRAVLRALKDLEYERGVGKISAEDYAELSARYREEARRLIQSVDEALRPAQQFVEADLARRLAAEGFREPVAEEMPVTSAPSAEETAAESDSAEDRSDDASAAAEPEQKSEKSA